MGSSGINRCPTATAAFGPTALACTVQDFLPSATHVMYPSFRLFGSAHISYPTDQPSRIDEIETTHRICQTVDWSIGNCPSRCTPKLKQPVGMYHLCTNSNGRQLCHTARRLWTSSQIGKSRRTEQFGTTGKLPLAECSGQFVPGPISSFTNNAFYYLPRGCQSQVQIYHRTRLDPDGLPPCMYRLRDVGRANWHISSRVGV